MLTGYRIYIDGVLTETHVDKTTSDTININIPDNINSYSIIFYFENFNHSNNLILTNYFTCHTNTYSGLEYLGLKNLSCNDFRLYNWVGMETNAYIDLINSHIKTIDCSGTALLYSLTIKGDLTSTLTSCIHAEGANFGSINVNVNGLTDFNIFGGLAINSATVNTKNITNFSYMFGESGIQSIKLSDTSNGTDFSQMFPYCLNLTMIPLLDTSNGEDFSNMFIECYNLTSIPLLNTSKGTNFSGMFVYCTHLKTIPLLDTSNGKDFNEMFAYSGISTIPLLDTSNGEDFSNMFIYCEDLETIPLLNTSKGTNFRGMFRECYNLKTIPLLDLSNASANACQYMFIECYALTNLGGFKGLKTDLDLSCCDKLTHESLMNVINNLAEPEVPLAALFLGSVNLAKLTDDEKTIAINKGWTLA
jgi:hypothetical protein